MNVLPLILVAIVTLADTEIGRLAERSRLDPLEITLASTVPIGLYVLVAWFGVSHMRKRWERGAGTRTSLAADRITRWARTFIVLHHTAAVLLFGWLHAVRDAIGNLVLLDEIIVLLPPILGIMGTWAVIYPLERRLRDALMERRLHAGAPAYRIPGFGEFMLTHLRMHLLPLLVPLLVILGLGEIIAWAAARQFTGQLQQWMSEGATIAVAAVVFLLMPLMLRPLLGLEPLPEGTLRETLAQVCERQKVRVRDLMVWRTGGSIINAAVMGLIGPLRYVLFTDALLETMTTKELAAVMAHEVGHVRRRHIPWLIVSLFATIIAATLLAWAPFAAAASFDERWVLPEMWSEGAQIALAILFIFFGFGWICRRYERQADTFAVQYLTRFPHQNLSEPLLWNGEYGDASGDLRPPEAAPEVEEDEAAHATSPSTAHAPQGDPLVDDPSMSADAEHITSESVNAMRSALRRVARLNMIDPRRWSWRHGSIAWRERYLASLVGRPVRGLPIDSLVRGINGVSALILIAGIAWQVWLLQHGPATNEEEPISGWVRLQDNHDDYDNARDERSSIDPEVLAHALSGLMVESN